MRWPAGRDGAMPQQAGANARVTFKSARGRGTVAPDIMFPENGLESHGFTRYCFTRASRNLQREGIIDARNHY